MNCKTVYLLTIYDKGEQKDITKKEIQSLKEINGLVHIEK